MFKNDFRFFRAKNNKKYLKIGQKTSKIGNNHQKLSSMDELSFYRDTHEADVILQPDLFRINNISHGEQLLNLCALLAEHEPAHDYVSLPSNEDAAMVLSSHSSDASPASTEEDTIKVGKYYITLITEKY